MKGKSNALPSWEKLFLEFSEAEQFNALTIFVNSIRQSAQGQEKAYREDFFERFAQARKFRPESLKKSPEEKLAKSLQQHSRGFLEDGDWMRIFIYFYAANRCPLMAAYLDQLQIPHDGKGIMSCEVTPPSAMELYKAARIIATSFSLPTVRNYLCVLHRVQQPTWVNIAEAIELLTEDLPVASQRQTKELEDAENDRENPELLFDQFTTLDRVLIDQVIATVSEAEGSLEPDAVEDLIETVISLNAARKRSIFHLGFLDGLLPNRTPQISRPQFNDKRRSWYLAGLLAAKARQQDEAGTLKLLMEFQDDFRAAAEDIKGAGPTIANQCFDYLFTINRHTEVMQLLKGQLGKKSLNLAVRAYHKATELWRMNKIDVALPILKLLRDRAGQLDEPPETIEGFLIAIERRYGQCLQSQGDMDAAQKVFSSILERVPDGISPELYADLGLVEGGFRNLDKVRLPEEQEARDSMWAALARGQRYFLRAQEMAGAHAVNACYALAVMNYLYWADKDANDAQANAMALEQVEKALTGMRESEHAAIYERMGILGQALFMHSVLIMDTLSSGESYKVLAQWQRIPSGSGRFPKQDIQKLLQGAALVNPEAASQIAESVWEKRSGADAWAILDASAPQLLQYSTYLQRAFLKEAQNPDNPRSQRFQLWLQLNAINLSLSGSACSSGGSPGFSWVSCCAEMSGPV